MAFRHMVIFTLFFLSILKVSQAMVFRHVVMFKYIPTVTEEQKQAVLDGLAGLPAQIPSIRYVIFPQNIYLSTTCHEADPFPLAKVA